MDWLSNRLKEEAETMSSRVVENEYHSPYDQHGESDQLNHYETPSMLARNPSGSLYIPSGKKWIIVLGSPYARESPFILKYIM